VLGCAQPLPHILGVGHTVSQPNNSNGRLGLRVVRGDAYTSGALVCDVVVGAQ
jgi:hypothetical protein